MSNVIVSGEWLRNADIYIYVYPFSPQTPFPSRPAHDIEQSSMCYTIGLCWLSILSIAMCT